MTGNFLQMHRSSECLELKMDKKHENDRFTAYYHFSHFEDSMMASEAIC